MADLTDVATDSLKAMTELELQAGDLHQEVTRLHKEAEGKTSELAGAQAKVAVRIGDFTKTLGSLQQRLKNADDQTHKRLGEHTTLVQGQTKDLDAKHKQVKEHCKELRAALSSVTGDLEKLQQNTAKQLQQVQTDTTRELTATAAALDSSEKFVRETTNRDLKNLVASLDERAKWFQKRVDDVMLPRIEADVKKLTARMEKISNGVTVLLTNAQSKAAADATSRVDKFQAKTRTDWRGGEAEPDAAAAARATALEQQAKAHAEAIAGHVTVLQNAASVFDQVTSTIRTKYGEVFAVPDKIDDVLRRV